MCAECCAYVCVCVCVCVCVLRVLRVCASCVCVVCMCVACSPSLLAQHASCATEGRPEEQRPRGGPLGRFAAGAEAAAAAAERICGKEER